MCILSGQNARIENPLVIFRNPNGNHPIYGKPDNIDSMSFISERVVDSSNVCQLFFGALVIQVLDDNKTRKIFIESCRIDRESIDLVDAVRL